VCFFPCLLQHYTQCCKHCCYLCSSFPCVLQTTKFFFNATSSCNVLCNVVAFFFSTSIANYSVFFFGTMNWLLRSIAKIIVN
jgi:hypothetical protein